MNVFDVLQSCQLRECVVALIRGGGYPVGLLSESELRWLREEFGDQLKSRYDYLYLEV